MTLIIDADEYGDLYHNYSAIVQVEAAEVQLMGIQEWQVIPVTHRNWVPFNAIITQIQDDAMYRVLSLQRLRFEWTNDDEFCYCQVHPLLRLEVTKYPDGWESSIAGYGYVDKLNSTYRTQAQLQAEEMLSELAQELCEKVGEFLDI